jgi:mannose-6-phosphate isomerase-like protein (cupin superfamily)
MEIVNAIAKVRFSAAKPQRIQLGTSADGQLDVICMETGQNLDVDGGAWTYYVITGQAVLAAGDQEETLEMGRLAVTGPDEPHTLSSTGEARLVCLAIHNGH